MRDERQGGDAWPAAACRGRSELDGGAGRGRGRLDVAHARSGRRRVGPKPPLVTAADSRPPRRGRACPRAPAPALGPQADALARRSRRRAGATITSAPGKSAASRRGASATAQPSPRLDRRGRGVDVVAVEAQARLEPQRVARAEPGRLHLAARQQQPCQRSAARRPAPRSRSRPRRCSRAATTQQGRPPTLDLGRGHERQARGTPAPAAPSPPPRPGPAAPAARGRPAAATSQLRLEVARAGARCPPRLQPALTTRNRWSPALRDHQVVEDAALVGR